MMLSHVCPTMSAERWDTQTRVSDCVSMHTAAMQCNASGCPTRPTRATHCVQSTRRGMTPTGRGYAPTTILPTSLYERGGTGGTGRFAAFSIAPRPIRLSYPVGQGWDGLRLGGPFLAIRRPHRPNNPRACVDTSSNNDRLELAGLSVQSLRAGPALAIAPAVIFTDPCRHARRHAREHACSVLITKGRSGAITPNRQPVPSVRPVGDGGGRGKKRSVPGYAPLCVHNFFGIDEAGRCTNP